MSRSPAPYRPPPWRTAVSAQAYVDERLRADSGLSAAIANIKGASGDRYLAELFDIKLVTVVEKARRLHHTLSHAEASNIKAIEAAAAQKVLARWALTSGVVDHDDIEALTRIGQGIKDTIAATSPAQLNRRLGVNRQTGQSQKVHDRRSCTFAIGELAHFVKTMGGGPQTRMVMVVAEALFNPDMDLFPDGVDAKNIEHWRKTYEDARAGGGPGIHWDLPLIY